MLKRGIYISKADWLTSRLPFNETEKQKANLFCHFVYQKKPGRIGSHTDRDVAILLKWLLTDAWGWNKEKQRVEKFAERSQSEYFVWSREHWPHPRLRGITYHQPGERLKKLFAKAEAYYARQETRKDDRDVPLSQLPLLARLSQTDLEATYLGLMNLVDECEMIAAWFSWQFEAILLLKDFPSFQARLQEACHERELELIIVDHEHQLPDWFHRGPGFFWTED